MCHFKPYIIISAAVANQKNLILKGEELRCLFQIEVRGWTEAQYQKRRIIMNSETGKADATAFVSGQKSPTSMSQ